MARIACQSCENLRTLVYTDYVYHRVADRVRSERAFSIFLAHVAAQLDGPVRIAGRLSPDPEGGRYEIGDDVEFVALPWYPSLTSAAALPALARSLAITWRAIGSVDRVWLLGPHPLILLLALFAIVRRRALVLGVRQDFPAYVGSRHPGNRALGAAAWLLERSFRLLGRFCSVVVVGPELARNYSHSRRLLETSVSLVPAAGIVESPPALAPSAGPGGTILSVGRLDTEKNPLLLAEVLDRLVAAGGDWRLEVCGEGPLADELEADLRRRGLADRAELAGYVPFDGGLERRYRDARVLLHSSWTEGLPQVLIEALAAGLPVVASNVGGIAAALGDAVALVEPGDAEAAAAAITAVVTDDAMRALLVEAGLAYVRSHTLELESARVAAFVAGKISPV
jgi:glycosyltransferase involved in cell wall biosynthesis